MECYPLTCGGGNTGVELLRDVSTSVKSDTYNDGAELRGHAFFAVTMIVAVYRSPYAYRGDCRPAERMAPPDGNDYGIGAALRPWIDCSVETRPGGDSLEAIIAVPCAQARADDALR